MEEEEGNRRVEASRQAKASHLAAVAGRAKASHQAARGEAAAGVGGPTLDVVLGARVVLVFLAGWSRPDEKEKYQRERPTRLVSRMNDDAVF